MKLDDSFFPKVNIKFLDMHYCCDHNQNQNSEGITVFVRRYLCKVLCLLIISLLKVPTSNLIFTVRDSL